MRSQLTLSLQVVMVAGAATNIISSSGDRRREICEQCVVDLLDDSVAVNRAEQEWSQNQ
jgi:hypothetical protein